MRYNQNKLHITLAIPLDDVALFMGTPSHLPKWTVHRALFYKDLQWFEVRNFNGRLVDAQLNITIEKDSDQQKRITFCWEFPDSSGYSVEFELQAITPTQTLVLTQLPVHLPTERLIRMKEVVQAELDILKAILENHIDNIPNNYWHLLQTYHLSLYQ